MTRPPNRNACTISTPGPTYPPPLGSSTARTRMLRTRPSHSLTPRSWALTWSGSRTSSKAGQRIPSRSCSSPARTSFFSFTSSTCPVSKQSRIYSPLPHPLFPAFPERLRDLLADETVVKAGVGIQSKSVLIASYTAAHACSPEDCKKLFTDYGVDTRNCVDLSLLARTVDNARWKGKYASPIGLARLCETYEELTLQKGRVQTSNWELPLDPRQQDCKCLSSFGLRRSSAWKSSLQVQRSSSAGYPCLLLAAPRSACRGEAIKLAGAGS